MCSFSAPKAKEDDDTSGDDPFIRGAQGRPQKKAENEAKHRSSRESISSSEDMRTELFRDAAASGSFVNVQQLHWQVILSTSPLNSRRQLLVLLYQLRARPKG